MTKEKRTKGRVRAIDEGLVSGQQVGPGTGPGGCDCGSCDCTKKLSRNIMVGDVTAVYKVHFPSPKNKR